MFFSIITGIKDLDFYLIGICIVSIIVLAISIERIYYIVFKHNIDGKAFMRKIQKLIKDGRLKEAKNMCKATASTLPKIVLSAIEKAPESERHIQNAVDLATMEAIPEIEKRTHYLAMLANVATLAGLLGTIAGLIQAFAAVAKADPSQKAELLAAGISLAMNTTAFGLIVAIPTLAVYAFIQSKSKKIIDEIDLYSVMTINLLCQDKEE